ncbi:MAG: hypothetical protein HYV27_15235 [Candidatus Hydrogenedentes bacterium]|nr:hypothetical protein [Candidatus Hydrogenedentota bacterium]
MTEIVLERRMVEVPMAVETEGYVSGHVEVQLRTREQKLALKRVTVALKESGARLVNGRVVDNGGDAIRWLLEQLAGVGVSAPVVTWADAAEAAPPASPQSAPPGPPCPPASGGVPSADGFPPVPSVQAVSVGGRRVKGKKGKKGVGAALAAN